MRAIKHDDDFQEPVQVNVEDVLVPIDSVDPYHELGPTEDILYDWAKKERFNLIKSKSEKHRVYFVCGYSRYKSLKPNRNAKRQSSSYKTGCPFILRITYKDSHNFWSFNEPKNEMEHTHNHPCTAAYNSISPFGKKEFTTQQDIKTIASMASNNSKDVANLSSEIKQSVRPNSTIKDAQVLIKKMRSKGYHVRHQVSQDINDESIKLKNLFFMHNNMIADSRKMGQVFIIDATYSLNNACFHNLGASTPVTFPVVFSFVYKCTAFTNALDTVFPSSNKILCIWHMMNSVRSELNKGCYTSEKVNEKCISLVMKMVNTKDQDYFSKCLAEFNSKSLGPRNIIDHQDVTDYPDFQNPVGKNKAYNYFNNNCRAESAYHALKVGMSKRMDLITAFDRMDTYWNAINPLPSLRVSPTKFQGLL
ncbi:hypothetical protein EDC94DRAFT_666009 [Helicostylum pulchrum]|nr:hypothetical protein EDC94DRAFT_666009 [Helicostylum pulchrum]